MTPASYLSTGMVDVPRQLYWTPVEVTGLVLPGLAVNLAKWESLPPVAQQILQDAIGVQAQTSMQQTMVQMRKFGDLIAAGKIIAVQPSDELQAAADKFEIEVLDGMLASVPAGVAEPQAVIDRLKGLMVKWQDIVNDLGIPRAPKDVKGIVAGWYADYDLAAYGMRFAEEVTEAKTPM